MLSKIPSCSALLPSLAWIKMRFEYVKWVGFRLYPFKFDKQSNKSRVWHDLTWGLRMKNSKNNQTKAARQICSPNLTGASNIQIFFRNWFWAFVGVTITKKDRVFNVNSDIRLFNTKFLEQQTNKQTILITSVKARKVWKGVFSCR